jgi:hypothetical protein
VQKDGHVFRIGKIPRTLQPIGERLEPRFGRLGREYQKVVFDKALLPTDPTLEWVTPGHPLFEAVRDDVAERVRDDLKRGAVFYDLQAKAPVRLDAFGASVKDGRGNTDLSPSPDGTGAPTVAGVPGELGLPAGGGSVTEPVASPVTDGQPLLPATLSRLV